MKKNKGRFKKGHTWREKKPFWDKEWLTQEYIINGKSAGRIAKEQNCIEEKKQTRWFRITKGNMIRLCCGNIRKIIIKKKNSGNWSFSCYTINIEVI